VKLLLDEMFSTVIAEQLRARGHDVVSIHEQTYARLEGASDSDVFAAALAQDRVLVTDNIKDFTQLEADTVADGRPSPHLIFTTNRQFPRSQGGTLGRLVNALDALMREKTKLSASIFLRPR
jgi:predicted nuclease of predicted toxin-antitoxin system